MLRGRADNHQDQDNSGSLAIVSYDEKPGIQAIATTAPDRPPLPGTSPTVMRDHEYKRHGTLTLMAGIDLLTGHVHVLIKERHRSREFIEFLKLLDAAYPVDTAIEVILDRWDPELLRLELGELKSASTRCRASSWRPSRRRSAAPMCSPTRDPGDGGRGLERGAKAGLRVV